MEISDVNFLFLCDVLKDDLNISGELGTVTCAIMERDIGEGKFGINPENAPAGWLTKAEKQLKVAETIKKGLGKGADWEQSNPKACAEFGMMCTTFSEWALTPREEGEPNKRKTAPKLGQMTVMNCWEMIMLAAFRSLVLSWDRIHKIYTARKSQRDWYQFLEEVLSFNKGIPYNIDKPTKTNKPVAGDIVFFDGVDHVAIATGHHDEKGTHVYSFWTLPNVKKTPNEGGTEHDILDTTIEELDNAFFEEYNLHFKTIEFTTPNW